MSAVRVDVRVHLGAAHERVAWDGRLAAVFVRPAVPGALSNRAVLRALAAWSDRPVGALRIRAGERSRSQVVEIDGLDRLPSTP